MTSEVDTSAPPRGGALFDKHLADVIAVAFALVIVLYSASGPISEFVRWVIETTTPAFDEMSRRDQRVFLREHWLGAAYRSFEQSVLLPTGLIIGLPIVMSFTITLLTLHRKPGQRMFNWGLTLQVAGEKVSAALARTRFNTIIIENVHNY